LMSHRLFFIAFFYIKLYNIAHSSSEIDHWRNVMTSKKNSDSAYRRIAASLKHIGQNMTYGAEVAVKVRRRQRARIQRGAIKLPSNDSIRSGVQAFATEGPIIQRVESMWSESGRLISLTLFIRFVYDV